MMRKNQLFNNDWLFHKGDIDCHLPLDKGPIYVSSKTERMKWGPAARFYNDAVDDFRYDVEFSQDTWVRVTLPHDYIIEQTPCKDENNTLGYFKYENAWYRKHFTLPECERGRRHRLFFEGIATNATVYLNGCLLGHNFCGYNSFEIDITDYVRYDEDNVIAVYVNTQNHEGWWYEGGGIYRNVYLLSTDLVAVDTYGVYASPQKLSDNIWKINFETTIFNQQYEDASILIKTYVYDADGNCICECAASSEIENRSTITEKYFAEIENPVLWDIDNPYLYNIKTDIIKNGEICDTYTTRTGFRTYTADPKKGFFLNGRHVKIKGVCAHQDCGLTGKAVADNVNRYKIELIKEMGANGYRTSHYPQNEAIMDALDELGFIVMAETRWYDSTVEATQQLEMLIKRDRNRPSIFFWSIGNEEPYHLTKQGSNICRSLKASIEKLDKTRLIMSAVANDPINALVYEHLDAVGINYNLQDYDLLHEKFPHLPVFASECCATGTTRGWYHEDCPDRGYLSAFDKDTDRWFLGREKTWKFITEREYVLGSYQWTAFEHRGETVWPRLCSQSGAIDLFLQKKDAFYQNQSHWSDKPMIHMLPHWNKGTHYENEPVSVWAYTNCQEAELILNGKSYGKVEVERFGHAEWTVPYIPGKIEVVGYINGTVAARDAYETTGQATQLMLRLENKISGANGRDVAIITCYTTDSLGRVVPDACPFVEFSTNKLGCIIGTGSDISDHTPVTAKCRRMRAGLISLAVKVGTVSGTLKIYAEAENLNGTCLSIEL